MVPYPQAFIARFWRKVDKTSSAEGCWLWTADVDKDGYGQIRTARPERKWLKAHRVGWELTVGDIPEGMHVLHKPPCVVRRCVLHLYLGTNLDNTPNMVTEQRSPIPHKKGSLHPMARLSEDDVARIRQLYATGEYTQKRLASMFTIPRQNVSTIVNGVSWSHLAVNLEAVRAAKARTQWRGEQVGHAKLNPEKIRAIRSAYSAGGTSLVQLARQYGVTDVAIHLVVLGKTWKHVH